MLLDKILGQDDVISYLTRLMKQDRIPPLIFYGKRATGKKKTAIALAGSINCPNQGCEICPSCKMLSLNIHPDIKVIEPDNDSIKIDSIRELINEASLSPTYKKRVYIIDNAHLLTQEASNCLLKTLEETSCLFILITNAIFNILSTIRSRCFIIRFKPLSFSTFKALEIEDEMLKEKDDLLLWIYNLKTEKPSVLINRFQQIEERIPFALELLLALLKEKGLYAMIDKVLNAKEALKAHVNRRLALENMVLQLKND